jgi:glycosyltransferase involved in cell wall biosynthesis
VTQASPQSRLTVIILTRDEALHIGRAITATRATGGRILVVDSGSTDDTVAIARNHGADVLTHAWRNHATQFNWALDEISVDTDWVLRLDADEILSPELASAISDAVARDDPMIAGYTVNRRMAFMGRPIHHGGLFPVKVIRLFRAGRGRCETRWMDEHIAIDGALSALPGELLDDCLKPLGFWTAKHNGYASREVIDILVPGQASGNQPLQLGRQGGRKRWLKERVYNRLPLGVRPLLYFFYRYVLRLGFLDGRRGLVFHVLQGFWYRFLVDAKLMQVRDAMQRDGLAPPEAIHRVLGINIRD